MAEDFYVKPSDAVFVTSKIRPDYTYRYEKHKLSGAIKFDLNLTIAPKQLVKNIADSLEIKVSETLEKIVANLFVSYFLDTGIGYSRDKNYYTGYQQSWYSYTKMTKSIDLLEEKEFVSLIKGKYYPNESYRSRFIPDWKFIQMLENLDCEIEIETTEPEQVLVLKDKNGKRIKFKPTRKNALMKKKVENYNDFIKNQKITLKIKPTIKLPYDFCFKLCRYIITNRLLINYSYSYHNSYRFRLNSLFSEGLRDHNQDDGDFVSNLLKFYREFWPKREDKFLQRFEIPIYKFGVKDEIELQFNDLSYYRVFKNNSFSQGGRFYGPCYQFFPEELRNYIHINGSTTVELDYSGFHVRLMYHLNGIEYTDDPYLITEEKSRDIYKIVSLVVVNEPKENHAVGAIKKKLIKNNLDLSFKEIWEAVRKFKEKHKPILNQIGQWGKMQFKDSQIAERIFMSLMKKDIPVLGIHDSFIVQEKHKDLLYDEMIKAYQKETGGFSPIIH